MIAAVQAGVEVGAQWREPAWLLFGAVCAGVLLLVRRARLRAASVPATVPSGASPLPRTLRTVLVSLPTVLEAAALVAFGAALARPVLVESEPPARLGRDVLLCLDRSSSMATEDLAPGRSRLAVAREVGAEFLLGRTDDRVGLVSFARFADLVCAPTVDRVAAGELLDAIRLVDAEGPEDATAIGAAVALCAELLQRSESEAGKVVVVLTDGEENVATAGAPDEIAPLHAGQWCRDLGVRVHTIALGRGDRQADGSFAPLDTTAVQQLAQISGGRFFSAADRDALRQVYAEIDRYEAARFAEPGVRVHERYARPTLLALVLLLVAYLWRRSPMGVAP